MSDFTPLAPAAQIGYLLVRTAELVSRPWLLGLQEHGINPRQFSVLAIIAGEPGLSQAELARRAAITPQSMAELLVRIEAQDLVRRELASPGRPARVELTDAGRRTLSEAYPIVLRLQDQTLQALDHTERNELHRLLTKLIEFHQPGSASTRPAS